MNKKMKIVVLDGFASNPGDLSWAQLEALGQCTVYDRTAPQQVIARAADAQIILTNKVVMSRDVIEALPHLKYIGVIATGYNIIDLDAARELHAVNLRASALDLLHNADDIARPACVQTHPEVVARLLNHLMEAHAAQANGDVGTLTSRGLARDVIDVLNAVETAAEDFFAKPEEPVQTNISLFPTLAVSPKPQFQACGCAEGQPAQ